MPPFTTAEAVGLAMRSQDLLKRQSSTGKEAMKKLAGDLEELIGTQENANLEYPEGGDILQGRRISPAGCKPSTVHDQQHVHEVSEDVHKQLNTILSLIKEISSDAADQQARRGRAPLSDTVELLECFINQDLLGQLLAQLAVLEFEARKDVMNVCCALLWSGMPEQIDKRMVAYLCHHPTIFKLLVEGYANEETALHYGVVLRSCARHAELVDAFLSSGHLPALLRFTQSPGIDISSDAFYTLREMLLSHKEVAAKWLERNHREFFAMYNELLVSGEYIAERQAQKLLTEVLLDKRFQKAMFAYVSNERNLQIHMNLLKDRSNVIQLEAFNVFKIFVANPQKPARIKQILFKNKAKLLTLLESIQAKKHGDEKVAQELRAIIDKLAGLECPTSPSTSSNRLGDAEASATRKQAHSVKMSL